MAHENTATRGQAGFTGGPYKPRNLEAAGLASAFRPAGEPRRNTRYDGRNGAPEWAPLFKVDGAGRKNDGRRAREEVERKAARATEKAAPKLTFAQKLKRMVDFKRIFNVQGKLAFSVLGIALISLGITICNMGNVGTDPFTAMNMGIAEALGLPFGTFQVFVNLAILVVVFTLDSSQLGIGTVVNMVAVGYLIEFFTWVLSPLPLIGGLLGGAIHLVVGTLVFTLGISLYMKTRMGVSPIDAIAPIAAKHTPLPFAACRVIQDVLVMGVALLVGGPVGVFTIVSAFCIGPLIALWNRAASLPMYERFGVLSKREVAEEV